MATLLRGKDLSNQTIRVNGSLFLNDTDVTNLTGEISSVDARVTNLQSQVDSLGTPSLETIEGWPAGVSATEVGHLDGVTSSIQTQLETLDIKVMEALYGWHRLSNISTNSGISKVDFEIEDWFSIYSSSAYSSFFNKLIRDRAVARVLGVSSVGGVSISKSKDYKVDLGNFSFQYGSIIIDEVPTTDSFTPIDAFISFHPAPEFQHNCFPVERIDVTNGSPSVVFTMQQSHWTDSTYVYNPSGSQVVRLLDDTPLNAYGISWTTSEFTVTGITSSTITATAPMNANQTGFFTTYSWLTFVPSVTANRDWPPTTLTLQDLTLSQAQTIEDGNAKVPTCDDVYHFLTDFYNTALVPDGKHASFYANSEMRWYTGVPVESPVTMYVGPYGTKMFDLECTNLSASTLDVAGTDVMSEITSVKDQQTALLTNFGALQTNFSAFINSDEVSYLGNVTSDIQTQLNDKVSSDVAGIAGSPGTISNIVSLTQAEYDAIGTPDANTIFLIVT